MLAGLIFGLANYSFSQTTSGFQIYGSVLNESGKPIDAATIILRSASDSALIKLGLSDKAGKFRFENIKEGKLILSVTSVGYQKIYSAPFSLNSSAPVFNAGNLKMKILENVLNEVSVQEKRRLIELRSGKVIMNVENSMLAVGNSALDLLKRAPGVQVDQNDQIRLGGKQNVLIMLNGKQTFLEPQALTEFLKSTQSNDIEQIELISNPSAKYEAAGGGALINIKTKKNKNYGINGSLTAMAGIGDLGKSYDPNFRYNSGLALNYRNKNVNIYGNYTHADLSQSRWSVLNRNVHLFSGTTTIDVDYFSRQQRVSETFRLGADYNLSPKHVVGVLFSGALNTITIDKVNTSNVLNDGVLDNIIGAGSGQERKLSNMVMNVTYKGSLGKKSGDLSFDFDYIRYDRSSLELLTNRFYDAANNQSAPDKFLRNNSPSDYIVKSLKLDYSLPMQPNSKLEFGLQGSQVKGNSRLDFGELQGSNYLPDLNISSAFKINEQIGSAYLNLSQEFKKLSLSAGLRTEYTNSNGRKYLNLFPSVQLEQTVNAGNKLLLSYGKRVTRPGYDNMNPYISYLDQYSLRSGNPMLRPEYTHNLEFTHVYKDKFSTTFRTSLVKDMIIEMNEQNNLTRVNVAINRNLERQFIYGLELNAPATFTKWWSAEFNLQGYYQTFYTSLYQNRYSNSSPDIIFSSTQSFTLPKGLNAEVSGKYETATAYGIYNFDAAYNVDAGLSKNILNNKGTIRLRVSDIFNTSQNRYTTTFQNLDLKNLVKQESRFAQLNFSYSFGKKTVKAARKRNTGSESEQRRIGQ